MGRLLIQGSSARGGRTSSRRSSPRGPGPAVARPKAQVDARGTNIFQAIQLALAMAPPGQANRIVLLTDGRQNAGNALAGAQAAKNVGVDIHYVAAPLTFTQE